jgi:hypothetical protein
MGFRLPTIEELTSLVNPQATSAPYLPSGHPFSNVQPSFYWSSTTDVAYTPNALGFDFGKGTTTAWDKDEEFKNVWCVRGGHGHDAY